MRRLNKRPLTIMEVLIAFALVVLCVFPLIAPHVLMLRAEYRFIDQVRLDHYVNDHYVSLLEQLHRNVIPWSSIEEGAEQPLEAPEIKPYRGSYRLSIAEKKPKESAPTSAYLVELHYRFTKDEAKKPVEYNYLIYLVRRIAQEEAPNESK
ncbi:MAG: hypothetical protein H7A37_06670 [Chlamydiales bacterium]|nr:hypothetical protein [Chlamydiia bacterium]MCP5507966.1 hypothetical protein [Chlamydiales bacterium]